MQATREKARAAGYWRILAPCLTDDQLASRMNECARVSAKQQTDCRVTFRTALAKTRDPTYQKDDNYGVQSIGNVKHPECGA